MAARMRFSNLLSPFRTLGKICTCESSKGTLFSPKFKRRFGTDVREVVVELSESGPLSFTSGELAKFADGCATVRLGDTTVMATAVGKSKALTGSFVPLTVDYRQKAAAAGRIPTNHLRRELGPTEKEILTSRMIDRSLRPRFSPGYCFETQITCNLLAVDGMNDPDIVSINAASAALSLSNIPWNGPIAAVRVGLVGDQIVINPSRKLLARSKLNLVISAAEHKTIVMLDGSCDVLPEHVVMKGITEGVKEAQKILNGIRDLQLTHGKTKREVTLSLPSEELIAAAESLCLTRVQEVFSNSAHDKISRDDALSAIRRDTAEKMIENFRSEDNFLIHEAISVVIKRIFRDMIFTLQKRCDGRDFNSLRNINCKVGLYNPLHGSALFQRGQTQVLSTVSFDSPESALRTDAMSVLTGVIKEKKFMLHYEFPPYATNETGRLGAQAGRRELGHGALAEKGIRPVIPPDFPFTIRLTSEVLESNGSSSMASVCGGSLALMDAGVPLTEPVCGVAVGLVSKAHPNKNHDLEKFILLTDILGIEDYLGDMDFKLAGTKKGFTALQLDVKLPGLPLRVMNDALHTAREGQKAILAIMKSTIEKPNTDKKENWPVCEKLDVPIHKRSKFIGAGGLNLKKLTAETGVQVSAVDESSFQLFAPNEDALQEAKEMIDSFLIDEKEPVLEFGAIYTAKIQEIRDIGVMVSLYPTMNPVLLHNSQLDQRKIHHPSALGLEVGQEISVKYFGRDPVSGVMRLSRKILQALPSSVPKTLNETSQIQPTVRECEHKA